MLQNVCGKKSHRWWDWSHRGTKCYKMSLWEKILLFIMPPPHRALAALQPRAPRQPQQTQYLGEAIETPETAATSLELLFSATTLRAAIPQQAPSADAIPTHRDAHVSIAPHPRKEIPTHSSQLAAPALSRTSQGIFRSCIRLGG